MKKSFYCNDCRLENMVNIIDKRCIACNSKIPIYNYPNEKQALYCCSCKLDDMIDVKN